MSDALNGSVAPFCHSQDRPGGVPVAVFDQPAGLTGESAFVQHRFREVCAERECNLIELETMPDHVHLLVECDPQYGIHRLVKQIKGRSSRALRQEFDSLRSRLPTLWTNSYFVATVGGAPLEVIKQYVANQRNA